MLRETNVLWIIIFDFELPDFLARVAAGLFALVSVRKCPANSPRKIHGKILPHLHHNVPTHLCR